VKAGRASAEVGLTVGLLALGVTSGAAASNRDAGRHYLALVEPVATAFATLRTGGGWVTSTCTTSAAAGAGATAEFCFSPQEQPVIAALEHRQGGLERFAWPRADRHDVRGLVQSIALEIRQLSLIDQPDATTWRATLQRDQHGVTAAANLVRHDFGLPATTSQ
jgi:hypothetical protein